jgi:hypothetical protein
VNDLRRNWKEIIVASLRHFPTLKWTVCMNCLRFLGRWDYGFKSYSRHGCLMCVCVYSVIVFPLFRLRTSDELITRPKSPTVFEN